MSAIFGHTGKSLIVVGWVNKINIRERVPQPCQKNMKSFFFNLLSRPVLVGFICRNRKVRTSRFAGVIVVTLLLVLSALIAQRGAFAQTPAPDDSATLDPSVNGTGIVTTPMGSANEEGYSVAIQADGKIVVTGFSRIGATDDVVFVRYSIDGSLDRSFNVAGI